MGAVVDRVRGWIPESYAALLRSSNWPSDGFQFDANFVKSRLFSLGLMATIAGVTEEAATYDIQELDLLGKLTTLRVIPAAVDFWGNQKLSQNFQTSTQTGNTTFPERREQLWKIYERLRAEVLAELPNGTSRRSIVGRTPKISFSGAQGEFVTRDPRCYPRLKGRITLDIFPPFPARDINDW